MSAIGVIGLFVVAAGADGIVERFGWFGLMAAVGVCCLMVWRGERYV